MNLPKKTERDSQTQKMSLWLPGRRDSKGDWEGHIIYTLLYSKWIPNMDLCICASLDGRGVWGRMDTCICMAKSPHCSPETTTTLLIGYTPIQNKKFKVWEKINTREAQSGRRLLGTNGGSLWLWCCLAQPGALGP